MPIEPTPFTPSAEHRGATFPLPFRAADWAFFLDVDGTLLEIATTPDAVYVPADLAATLRAIADRNDGALALVSGRSIETLDALFAPERFAAAGLHGFETRTPDGRVSRPQAPAALDVLRPRLAALAGTHAGAVLEDKGSAIAVHYRLAPEAGPALEAAIRGLAGTVGDSLAVQLGKMVIELRPAASSKGTAVSDLAAAPPFAGRRLIALGDDLTDEAMFRVVNELGGVSVRVGGEERPSAARFRAPGVAAVRDWLAGLARGP